MKKHLLFYLLFFCIYSISSAQIMPTEGDGTVDHPYLVSSLDHLRWISEGGDGSSLGDGSRWQLYYKQTADIDAADTKNWNTGEGFRPMGNTNKKFKGNYDGSGFTISNLYINRIVDYVGLFGYIDKNGVVKNLQVTDMDITGDRYVGGLSGYLNDASTLSNILLTGNVTARRFFGGVVGEGNVSSVIENTITFVTLTGTGEASNNDNRAAGGIAGRFYDKSVIRNSYAVNNFNVSLNKGGLVALSQTSIVIENSYWDTEISGIDIADSENKFPDIKGLTTAEFGDSNNFNLWDFDATWAIAKLTAYDNQFRPYLQRLSARTVSLSTNDDSFGSVEGDGVYHAGNNATITATPANEYNFIHWLNGETIVSTDAEYSFEITNDVDYQAVFELKKYTITVTQGTNGTITPSTTVVDSGSSQIFTIVASEGYEISDVLVDGESQGVMAEYTFTDVMSDHTITASFTEVVVPTYTLTVVQVSNGTITPSTTVVDEGSDQTFTIVASEGYEISEVLVDGESQGVIAEYTFTDVMSDHTITASFTEVVVPTYTLTVVQVSNGTITPSTTVVDEGSDQTFIIEASEGFEISEVLVDGESQGVIDEYTFTDVMSDHTITASFKEEAVLFTIQVIENEGGNITPGTTEVSKGESITYSIEENEGYMLVDVQVDGESKGSVTTYTFENVESNHSIEAIYNKVHYITVIEPTNGEITPSSMYVVEGQNQTFVFTPNEGYIVSEILVNGEDMGSLESYTFKEVSASNSLEVIFIKEELPTSLDPSLLAKVKVGPNPTSDKITLAGVPINTKVVIYNLIGNIVYSNTTQFSKETIDMSLLNSGIYVIHIENIGNFKIIKE
ncbi:InlB B-repeat-containing protein [Flammeovirga agarivorans]|uniref:T9SS type A sorting domain-containing protein n=1 Tax=Flammeovirga agarivorans TaxID=2726742 RepID=A0A7X8SPN7_9BACT|nr:T9SS type A sorting domain-containing protein [Flammeovirga agarivorans]NLR94074.1 T9SS type A sorting domain-containing protein [Flammeovirga agarivorans]